MTTPGATDNGCREKGHDRARRLDLERIGERFTRHERASLHFSGGKDSLACLFLLRPWWDRIVVTWCNTGDAFPETEALVRRVQATVPHFREARSYVRPSIEIAGWPVEALPAKHTEPVGGGPGLNRQERPLLQLYTTCCYQNLWAPLYLADLESKATIVFRGTRLEDSNGRTRRKPGEVVGGLEQHMPIWEWTDADVWAFLEAEGVDLPPHYKLAPGTTSLDCMHCTAWWRDGAPGQLRVLEERYPETHREVVRRLRVIRDSIAEELAHLDRALRPGVEAAP
jgi:3'-phosphoadenosine 5'-phosphosulfate sulfotransferase (PAPS reductase)/FAD synthetase